MNYTTFTNGEDIDYDEDEETVNNALTSIHIYESKDEPPVPSADDKDEENPNTLDSKIVIILATVASSIAAEGIIIGDLVRRLYNYKKAISSNFF